MASVYQQMIVRAPARPIMCRSPKLHRSGQAPNECVRYPGIHSIDGTAGSVNTAQAGRPIERLVHIAEILDNVVCYIRVSQ